MSLTEQIGGIQGKNDLATNDKIYAMKQKLDKINTD